MKKLWDISPPIQAASPVFPGDTAYSQQWMASIGPGCPVNVSAITLSPHVGAHADAPLHYDPAGDAIGAVDLQAFLGPCRVIHAIGCGPLVRPEHLAHALGDLPPGSSQGESPPPGGSGPRSGGARGLPPRVLVRVYERMPQDTFDHALTAFAPETVALLADRGVVLIGIDSASIDPVDSKTLDSHQTIRQRGLRVLENLLLDDVPEGDYELIALPLKLVTADASPVRAVLRELPTHP
ncbi:MAG: cyclase family protein [Hydrogenophaga sp.]|jgi:arylformamidase|nr:cyclase family protein [Hydrogenophaga sp.]